MIMSGCLLKLLLECQQNQISKLHWGPAIGQLTIGKWKYHHKVNFILNDSKSNVSLYDFSFKNNLSFIYSCHLRYSKKKFQKKRDN